MNRSLQIKLGLVVVLLAWSVWSLWPTFQTTQLTDEKRTELESTNEGQEELDRLHAKAIKQGLDLQGGMYLILEIDETGLEGISSGEAIDRVVEILRNRVDQFGVSEPDIRKQGDHRIIVQLPGIQDRDRAVELIGRTARLEFRMVQEGAEVTTVLSRLDRVLSGAASADEIDGDESAAADATAADTDSDTGIDSEDVADATTDASDTTLTAEADSVGELFRDLDDTEVAATDFDKEHPLTALTGGFFAQRGGIPVSEANVARIDDLLARPEAQRVMPRDAEFLWGSEALSGQDGSVAYLLYLVNTKVDLAGGEIQTAGVSPDPERPPLLMVNLAMTRLGGLQFANVTGNNIGQKLGIVLDDVVISAPVINSKIQGGRAVISGGFQNDEEARDLALLLRAGALPVDVHIEEERTVGPSLGRDSIRKGVRSTLIGGAVVIVFMIIYYRVAGLLATAGLALTLLLLMGVLAQLHLTLTLPGIAGIILTVGMAVDANVLIFERIREELRTGKSVRAAVDSGFAAATRAIVDANITTFIAALVLYYFGTGPIRGFAVTLSIGILTSMFSALIFTRSIYDLWLSGRSPKSLSI